MLSSSPMKFLFRIVCIGILLSFPEAWSSSFLDGPTRYSLVVGGGPQWVRTDLTNDLSKAGYVLLSEVLMEKQAGGWGAFGLGLGFQRASQQGRTLLREQVLAVNNPVLDVTWALPVAGPQIEMGALARNMVGAGSHFDFTKLDQTQWLLSIGPQLRYRHALEGGGEIVAALAYITDVTSPNHTVWQIPLQISYTFAMDQKFSGGSAGGSSAAPSGPTP